MKCEAGGSGSLIATLAIIFVLIIRIKENFQYSILKSRHDQQFRIFWYPREELIPTVVPLWMFAFSLVIRTNVGFSLRCLDVK
ncbi:hypothetical protein H5410_055595 [Solanum commersonii]|uniref:Uncharacterized protein n=1 Tax=Solanum commersonii TaxID=4109 RepID=A0A9J5WJ61_SOLCO|nr:hypothetical protein H5410_055595 [Solanum commersonii]